MIKARRINQGKPITCAFCGVSGGTLMKLEDGRYIHQDRVKCAVLASRRK